MSHIYGKAKDEEITIIRCVYTLRTKLERTNAKQEAILIRNCNNPLIKIIKKTEKLKN